MGGTVWRAPVTPACETQYTNEEERDVTNLMRCVDDSGVLSTCSGTKERSNSSQRPMNSSPSFPAVGQR